MLINFYGFDGPPKLPSENYQVEFKLHESKLESKLSQWGGGGERILSKYCAKELLKNVVALLAQQQRRRSGGKGEKSTKQQRQKLNYTHTHTQVDRMK